MPRTQRILVTLAVALGAVLIFLCRALAQDVPWEAGGDFHHTEVGARILFGGNNIFVTHPIVRESISGDSSVGEYPLPAYVVCWPFSFFRPALASSLWIFVTTAALTWILSARGWDGLFILASYPMIKAFSVAQWEPLIVCGMVVPWAAAFICCKFQVGLPILAAFPDRRRLAAVALFLGFSLLLMPGWFGEWLHGLPTIPGVRAQQVKALFGEYELALLCPGGLLLLLALLRWRDWRARLLLATSVMPQAMNFHHQLPLGFVPQTRRRMLLWVALTWVGAAIWGFARWRRGGAMAWDVGRWACLLTLWLPTFIYVMIPPSVGAPAGADPAEALPCQQEKMGGVL